MTDRRTDGGDCNITDAFLKKRGYKKVSQKYLCQNEKNYCTNFISSLEAL